ncbi:MAG: MMPL family transporter [Myxococcales bacterium]|nr:MMPL family transporter [Myxococcales bacterium]
MSLVAVIQRRRGLALIAGVLLVLGGAALSTRIAFSSDVTEHMPKVSPAVTQWLELSRRFDAFNSLIIGLEEPGAPLTAEGLAAVKKVTDALAAQKAGGVLSVTSVTNVESIQEGVDGALETSLLVSSVPADAPSLEALGRKIAANPQVSGALISRDERGYMVLVRADPRKDPAELAALVQRTVEEHKGPLVPAYFGAAFFSDVITRGVYAKLPWLVPAFVALLLIVLGVMVRRVRIIAVVLGCAAASLVVWLGLVSALGIVLSFTSLTALLGVLVLAVAAYARGLEEGSPNPLPWPVVASVLAVGVAAAPLRLLPFAYVSNFGLGLSLGAIAVLLVGVLLFVPLSGASLSPMEGEGQGRGEAPPSRALVLGALVVALAAAGLATRAHFRATPQSMFTPDDEIGRSLAFFDRRFGGPDFIQVDFRGDLRDPNVAARLMRLTDLLEGSRAFSDVRSVSQILGFLNKGFGGVHRIPPSRDSLANLWFFLEGRPDVKNLASDARDEAMVVLRVPTVPEKPVPELVGVVEAAVKDSLSMGAAAAKQRLLALSSVFAVALAPGRVDEVVAEATAPLPEEAQVALSQESYRRVRAWLATPDSPYSPTDAEWAQLEVALAVAPAERAAKVEAVAASFPDVGEHAKELTETILTREHDSRLAVRAAQLVERLAPGAPEAFTVRAAGVITDLLDPHPGTGEAATVTVTGLPVVAAQIEGDLLRGLWTALGLLLGVGALALLVLTRRLLDTALTVLAAAMAAAVTLGTTGTFGFGVDSGSAALFLVPPVVTLVAGGAPGSTRRRAAFLVAVGAAGLALLLVGLAPVSRIGLALAVGLGAAAASAQLVGTRRSGDVSG